MRYRLTLAYDGTDFYGWQKQPGLRTIQSDVENAFLPLSPQNVPVNIHGSGRTDAGVHAEGQVAHVDLAREMTPIQLRRALNGRLPAAIRVLTAEPTAEDFDARRNALGKEYRYRIWNAEVCDPLQARYRTHVVRPLNSDTMREATAYFVGENDFSAFSANPSREIDSNVREIYAIKICANGPQIEIRVSGNGFLYKMVRSIAGFLIAVGIGREKPQAVEEIMASKIRTARVESAPPQGLSLYRVWYNTADATPPAPASPAVYVAEATCSKVAREASSLP